MPLSFPLAVALTVAVVWLARRQAWGWSAPMIVYGVAWSLAIGIYEARLFPFYDLAGSTWLAIGVAGTVFAATAFGGGQVARRASPPADSARRVPGLRRLMRVFLLIGLTGAAFFLWQVHETLGLHALVLQPKAVHDALTTRTIGSSHLFLYYLGVAGTMLFGYLVIVVRDRVRAADVMLLGLFVAAMATSTERNHLLWVAACWLFLVAAPPVGDARLGRLLAAVALMGLLGGGFYLLGGQWLGKSPENLKDALIIEAVTADPTADANTVERLRSPGYQPDPATDVPEGSRLRWLLPGGALHRFAVLYMAIGATLPALDQGLRTHPRSHGQLTFRPVVRALSRLGLMPDTLTGTTYDDVRTPYPANAYTYLYEHCRDFGLAGAVVFPALFGFLAGWAYQRVALAPRSYWAVWLATLQAMIIWSPFQNRFVLTVSAYLVASLLVAQLVAARVAPSGLSANSGPGPRGSSHRDLQPSR